MRTNIKTTKKQKREKILRKDTINETTYKWIPFSIGTVSFTASIIGAYIGDKLHSTPIIYQSILLAGISAYYFIQTYNTIEKKKDK